MDLRHVVRIYGAVARPEILRGHLRKSCIASTWITIQVMQHFGFDAIPLQVKAVIWNPDAVAVRDATGKWPGPAAMSTSGPYRLQLGSATPPGASGLGGHLVAKVGQHIIVDASIDQANRPEIGVELPPVLNVAVDERFPREVEAVSTRVNGCEIEYRRHPTGFSYEESYDWGSNPETESAVDRIAAKIRSRIGEN